MSSTRKLISTLVVTFTLSLPTFAWGPEGHMAVAYVAYQHLNASTKARVDQLLRRNPDYKHWKAAVPSGTPAATRKMLIFMMAATWPDLIKKRVGYTDDGTDGGNRPDGASSSQNIGYSDHLRHRYWHFVDKPVSTDGTALPALPAPNAVTQITAFRAVLASNDLDEKKSYDLVWLEHLVGDIHQPLHAATRVSSGDPKGDNGGNLVTLCAAPCKQELHGFWDGALGSSSSAARAVTVGRSLPTPDATLAAKKDAADWAAESFEAAKKTVYVPPIAAGNGPFTLDATYKNNAKALARDRVALAGIRLANLLNDELK